MQRLRSFYQQTGTDRGNYDDRDCQQLQLVVISLRCRSVLESRAIKGKKSETGGGPNPWKIFFCHHNK